jgi:hypothetical protein
MKRKAIKALLDQLLPSFIVFHSKEHSKGMSKVVKGCVCFVCLAAFFFSLLF